MDEALREAIREAVMDVLTEERLHPAFHKRGPLSKQVDPEGKTWISATASRAQAIAIILSFLATIFAGIMASMAIRDEVKVYPRVQEIIDGRLKDHEAHVKQTMEAVKPLLASKEEVAELAKQLAVSRAERIEQYTAIQLQLNRIEDRLARIGK